MVATWVEEYKYARMERNWNVAAPLLRNHRNHRKGNCNAITKGLGLAHLLGLTPGYCVVLPEHIDQQFFLGEVQAYPFVFLY